MDNRYELGTINDMVTKIPLERLDAFLAEFPGLLRAVAELYHGAKSQGVGLPLPSTYAWIDDEDDAITMCVTAGDEKLADIKITSQ